MANSIAIKIQKLIKHNFHPDNIGLTITEISAVLVWMVSTLVFYVMLNQSFPAEPLFQWKNSITVICTYFVVDGLTFGILYRNFQSLALTIENKELDNFLLLPVNLKQYLSFRNMQFSSLIQVPVAIIAFLIFGNYTLITFILWVFTLILGFIISYELWFLFISISFWFKSDNRLTNLWEELSAIGMFPAQVYIVTKSILFFYPFLAFASLPAAYFINNQSLYFVGIQIVIIIVLSLLNRILLSLGVRTYRS
jgi:ABC-type uncharacterized transport system permease subunit